MSLGRVFVAGHRGMVGSAIVRRLEKGGDAAEILTVDRNELDLTDQRATFGWLGEHRPDVVIISAAKVSGIHAASTYRADFIYQNLAIETNLIPGSYLAGIQRIPYRARAASILKWRPNQCRRTASNGPLEPTNEPYAIAKIAGIQILRSPTISMGLTIVQ